MLEIQDPFGIKGIPLKPEIKGRLKVDETLIQSLAAIMGYDGEARRLLTCSLSGSLHVVGPPVTGGMKLQSTGADEEMTFTDEPVTEVMILANPPNTGSLWVNIGATASPGNFWPLNSNDILRIPINNMKELHVLIRNSGDQLIIMKAG